MDGKAVRAGQEGCKWFVWGRGEVCDQGAFLDRINKMNGIFPFSDLMGFGEFC